MAARFIFCRVMNSEEWVEDIFVETVGDGMAVGRDGIEILRG